MYVCSSPAEILRMVQGLLTHLALPGDVLLKEGTIGRGLFFIMRGKVIVQGKRPILTDEQQDYVRQKFESFDDDRSGSIDSLELIDAVASLGYEVGKSEIKRMMHMCMYTCMYARDVCKRCMHASMYRSRRARSSG